MKKLTVEPGSTVAPSQFYMTIQAEGPYMVYGQPPLKQQFMLPNRDGEIWYYKAGKAYATISEPTALCRCGASGNKPYCDGSHLHADWDPTLVAFQEPLLDGAETSVGPEVTLTDNQSYCAFARFCDAKGQVWNLVEAPTKEAGELTVRESDHCPAGRLSAWLNDRTPHEPHFDPSLGLLEDPQRGCSAGLWVRGGIPVSRADGYTYEVRNRVTLCRCGQSANKPFCDGTHAVMRFKDGLPTEPDPNGEEW